MIGLWQTTYNRVRPHSSLGYRPPAPVSDPDLAFRLPMTATMQSPLNWLGPQYRSGQDVAEAADGTRRTRSRHLLVRALARSRPAEIHLERSGRPQPNRSRAAARLLKADVCYAADATVARASRSLGQLLLAARAAPAAPADSIDDQVFVRLVSRSQAARIKQSFAPQDPDAHGSFVSAASRWSISARSASKSMGLVRRPAAPSLKAFSRVCASP